MMIFLKKIIKFYQTRHSVSMMRHCGNNFSICSPDFITWASLSVGNNVFIGMHAFITADVTIGNNVMSGAYLTIIGGDHIFGIKGISNRRLQPTIEEKTKSKVIVEDEVWFGVNVTLLKGVIVGMGAVIGGGTIVTKDVPPFTVNVGNPSMPIKKIFDDNELMEHLIKLNYSESIAQEVIARRSILLSKYNAKDIGYHKNTNGYFVEREF